MLETHTLALSSLFPTPGVTPGGSFPGGNRRGKSCAQDGLQQTLVSSSICSKAAPPTVGTVVVPGIFFKVSVRAGQKAGLLQIITCLLVPPLVLSFA